tara:strand:+ start:1360 stop:1629 length:270 start_codon:yes stop_codon:yes gene_type:complete
MTPLNRSLLVNVLSQEEDKQSAFYLPDDIITGKRPFEVVEIVGISSESKFIDKLNVGDKIVVEGHMLREINVFGKTTTLIEDNYVLTKM